jgi:hypothetical protein
MEWTRRSFLQTSAALAAAGTARPAPGDRITIGVIGCGARSQELMTAILQHPQAEIVGLVDAYTGRIERSLQRVKGRAKAYKDYRDVLAEYGLRLSGQSPDGGLVEVIELPDHAWFIGCQFHPELKSRPTRPHPLFAGFIAAALRRRQTRQGGDTPAPQELAEAAR